MLVYSTVLGLEQYSEISYTLPRKLRSSTSANWLKFDCFNIRCRLAKHAKTNSTQSSRYSQIVKTAIFFKFHLENRGQGHLSLIINEQLQKDINF